MRKTLLAAAAAVAFTFAASSGAHAATADIFAPKPVPKPVTDAVAKVNGVAADIEGIAVKALHVLTQS